MAPLVSVIIPTYNRALTILRAVDSVLRQEKVDFELIVVDDGSTDNTKELLDDKIQNNKIIYLYEDNKGVSAARNLGIKAAKGEWIAFLDSDDEWLPHKLLAQTQDLKARPEFLVSQSQEIWIRRGQRVNPGVKHQKKEGDIFLDSVKLCLISPSAVIMKADLFPQIGLFDETLVAGEDYDLWLRLTVRFKVGLLDEPLVIRYNGALDQLSAQRGLDFYRVKALEKILTYDLTPEQRKAAFEEMARRKRIYEAGAAKRRAQN
ncbi:MAG: glycosyltransferase [Deltaproteobacteria bacterium]|jgi:glycosyltransferase involved in cell wall biosynthesis|nr:glycosyltransferase [Deltaproteobacteria bacterium]